MINYKDGTYSLNVSIAYDNLLSLIGFEDADEIIMGNESLSNRFLAGVWRRDGYDNYLEITEYGRFLSNDLPGEIMDIAIIDKDTISVRCDNGNAYRLRRVDESQYRPLKNLGLK